MRKSDDDDDDDEDDDDGDGDGDDGDGDGDDDGDDDQVGRSMFFLQFTKYESEENRDELTSTAKG